MGLVLWVAAAVFHHDQARRLGAALAHGQDGVHAQLGHLFLVQHLGLDAVVLFGHALGLLGQVFRVTDVGGRVAQIPGEVHAATRREAEVEGFFQGLAAARGRHHQLVELALGRLLALVLGKGVQLFFQGAADQIQAGFFGADCIGADHRGIVQGNQCGFGRAVFQGADHGNQRLAVGRLGSLGVIAGADNQKPAPGLVCQRDGSGGGVLATDVAVLLKGFDQAVQGFVCLSGRRRPGAFFRQANNKTVGFGAGNGFTAQAEIHGNSCLNLLKTCPPAAEAISDLV